MLVVCSRHGFLPLRFTLAMAFQSASCMGTCLSALQVHVTVTSSLSWQCHGWTDR